MLEHDDEILASLAGWMAKLLEVCSSCVPTRVRD